MGFLRHNDRAVDNERFRNDPGIVFQRKCIARIDNDAVSPLRQDTQAGGNGQVLVNDQVICSGIGRRIPDAGIICLRTQILQSGKIAECQGIAAGVVTAGILALSMLIMHLCKERIFCRVPVDGKVHTELHMKACPARRLNFHSRYSEAKNTVAVDQGVRVSGELSCPVFTQRADHFIASQGDLILNSLIGKT